MEINIFPVRFCISRRVVSLLFFALSLATVLLGQNNVRLEFRNSNNSVNDNQLGLHFNVINDSSVSLPYGQLTVRYWFTSENPAPLDFWVDWAQIGSSAVNGSFQSIVPRSGADTYLEISFDAAAGQLADGGNSGNIQARFAKSNWGNFNESDDHSCDSNLANYTEHAQVTLDLNGGLVWGIEP